MALTYAQLTRTHPEYDADGWRCSDALYAGGKKLLGDKAVMDKIFPQHVGEEPMVYQERRKRAFSIPYVGQIVDGIVAAVFSDTFTVEADGKPLEEGGFWASFNEDVSPVEGPKVPLRQLMREQMRTAQIKRRAWTLVELPPPPEVLPPNRLEEERAGQTNAYALALDPACVTNWAMDRSGELTWAMVRYLDTSQRELDDADGLVRAEYTLYTRQGWKRWSFSYTPDKEPKPTDPVEAIPGVQITDGHHSFGRVPLLRHELPEGLWSMGKLEPLAIEHFNKECAASWGEYRSLFQFLAFFLADSATTPDGDPNRSLNQRVGPGRAWTGHKDDRVEVISMDVAPVETAMRSLDRRRDEMFRVVHQMSQSVDANSAAAQKQSGESKKQDKKGECLVYLALGELARGWVVDVLEMAAAGRGERATSFEVKGLDSYDDLSLEALVNQEAVVETIPVRSQTFQVERQYNFASRYLPGATPEVLQKIRQELEANIAPEEFAPIVNPDPTRPGPDGEPEETTPPVHGPKAKPPGRLRG
jgi:hypothetical protein